MVDYVKMWAVNVALARALFRRKDLVFRDTIDKRTGKKLRGVKEADFHNLLIKIHGYGRVEISGSLHVFFNRLSGYGHNYNLFTFKDLKYTINYLSQLFNLNTSAMIISKIEFGYNISPKFSITDFLNALVAFKNTPFNIMEVSGVGNGRECFIAEHGLKVYDKGLQYTMMNILRYERKTIKMRSIFGKEIRLQDLLNDTTWIKLHNEIIKSLEDLIIHEPLSNTDNLSKYDRRLIFECTNPLAWKKFKIHERAFKKKKYNAIINEHATVKYKAQLKELLNETFQQMLEDKSNVSTHIV